MPLGPIDVHRVRFAVDEHPSFLAPEEFFDIWIKQRVERAADGLTPAISLPERLEVLCADLPPANFQGTNFCEEPAVDETGRIFLERTLGQTVRFYPLPPDASDRWLAQPTLLIDCLDEDRSDWRTGATGVRTTIFRYALRSDVILRSGLSVFRFPLLPRGSWLCTDDFVRAVEIAQVTGLRFERLMRMPDPEPGQD